MQIKDASRYTNKNAAPDKPGVAVFITGKTDFKENHFSKDDERQQSWEDITLFSHNDQKT